MKIIGKTRFDHIRSQNIWRQYNVEENDERIRWRRDEWNQHVSRKAPERIVSAVRETSPTGRCISGRPYENGMTYVLERTG
jgi:hypothetical protein